MILVPPAGRRTRNVRVGRIAMRCCALDKAGLRCRTLKGVELAIYHGENEIYSYPCVVPWVAVPLCEKHRIEIGQTEIYKEKEYAKAEQKRNDFLKRRKRERVSSSRQLFVNQPTRNK
jgi:hypothetical protein